ncbi:hypothetical protein [Halobacillus karajensis]|uniref:hypothetical protein n=1 Tax=Halobacillus karajensis TaxID=195088 RepID=UPI00045C3435|nr:hypothetical protein [Halobacillus karajensis]CDQ21712.1 hypothetical protein BN982_04121 [Halobacillus karajensis]
MYKLIQYNDSNKILQVVDIEGVVTVQGDYVEWSQGSIDGLKGSFIIIESEDEFKAGDTVGDSTIAKDLKGTMKPADLKQENAELKAKISELEAKNLSTDESLISLYEMMMGV